MHLAGEIPDETKAVSLEWNAVTEVVEKITQKKLECFLWSVERPLPPKNPEAPPFFFFFLEKTHLFWKKNNCATE